ncbi:MAG TPA: L-seryl-tRNA(Sec) selenium transferase [Pyrinomonadaceae bacterium]|nr:L-seryl-tRNA(Sec) selenium transferase [Pyrinomonadaceae bacterium]
MPKSAAKPSNKTALLRALPSVDALLRAEIGQSVRTAAGVEHATNLAREAIEKLRAEILAGTFAVMDGETSLALVAEAEQRLAILNKQQTARGMRRLINATGVILHTNLGRAPLSDAARRAIAEAAGYGNLEFDLNSGNRGRRGARAEDLLATLTGTEAALVVNNCAAAALLVLTVLAREGETIVSRGELVEIGGDFRVPEVMAQSGTRMVEVGTTNRTKLLDYQKALTADTRLLMRVHTSNYRIVGFTQAPTLKELATLAHENGLLLYEDAGSGALIDFSQLGITGEPVIRESFAAGVDVISFSGDKLLGGPQAGLLVGRGEVIERMRKHSLYRALRADKFRIAALEATLEAYARNTTASELPTHQMISITFDDLKLRVTNFLDQVRVSNASGLHFEIVEGESAIGGGAAPTSRLRAPLVSITHAKLSANQIEERLRQFDPPVIARIEDDRVLLDLRTVTADDEAALASAVTSLEQ